MDRKRNWNKIFVGILWVSTKEILKHFTNSYRQTQPLKVKKKIYISILQRFEDLLIRILELDSLPVYTYSFIPSITIFFNVFSDFGHIKVKNKRRCFWTFLDSFWQIFIIPLLVVSSHSVLSLVDIVAEDHHHHHQDHHKTNCYSYQLVVNYHCFRYNPFIIIHRLCSMFKCTMIWIRVKDGNSKIYRIGHVLCESTLTVNTFLGKVNCVWKRRIFTSLFYLNQLVLDYQ